MTVDDFNYIDFFKTEVQNENTSIKLEAVNRVNLIASALGPQKTVSELIPFVVQVIQDENMNGDEQFLFNMAKQYAVLCDGDYINGRDELLIAPLEFLAAQEETVIRDQAVISLCSIIEKRPSLAPEYLVPMVERLVTKTDFFTARVSACALLPTCYRFANEDQKAKLRTTYTTLCGDDTPMVRRSAALKMRDFVAVCDKADLLTDMIPFYKTLSQEDAQDIIRVSCMHTTVVIAGMLSAEENKVHTIPVVKDAIEDRSWRVRLTVSKIFDQLVTAYGPELSTQVLLPCFVTLFKDNEQEVRKEAVKTIETLLKFPNVLTSTIMQQYIFPAFPSLCADPAQTVRSALAQIIGAIAKVSGKDLTQRHLLSLIQDLIKDEFHDVRLNIVSHTGLICEVLGVEGLVHSLLYTIQSLIMDNHWRIRQSVVEQVPRLAELFGVEMFQTKLEALFISSLRDSVHSVREAAIIHLKAISTTFGPVWTVEHLLPKIVEQYSHGVGYASRVTTLHVLPQVSGVMTPEQVVQYIIPLLVKATKDNVPNVRFCACRTIAWMLENHNINAENINTVIKPALEDLDKDSDIDVQYFAMRALTHCTS